ncbi:MAG: hypothetical protein KDA93_18990 [Planctomycetaceae bacterium]|nr:hypothetical protein [Planctomycetaceae bacterium]
MKVETHGNDGVVISEFSIIDKKARLRLRQPGVLFSECRQADQAVTLLGLFSGQSSEGG